MAIRFSTGTCNLYQYPGSPFSSNPSVHNLGASNQAADHFNYWYTQVGLTRYRALTDFDVFPEDFLDEAFCSAHPRCDLNPAGGSDVPEIYWFQGHGSDHQIHTTRGSVDLRSRTIWGNGAGNLQFLFLMACSTMPLADLSSWFGNFGGLHMAVGNSKRIVDSLSHGVNFAAWTSGAFSYAPGLSVGDAWMMVGLVDAEEGCSAVALAAGNNQADAEDRGAHERIKDNRPKPQTRYLAWRIVTKPG